VKLKTQLVGKKEKRIRNFEKRKNCFPNTKELTKVFVIEIVMR
jgi:hypothetical protein